MVIYDLAFLALTAIAFALLFALVKGTERLRQGAGDE
jgi:hypothetical protein